MSDANVSRARGKVFQALPDKPILAVTRKVTSQGSSSEEPWGHHIAVSVPRLSFLEREPEPVDPMLIGRQGRARETAPDLSQAAAVLRNAMLRGRAGRG